MTPGIHSRARQIWGVDSICSAALAIRSTQHVQRGVSAGQRGSLHRSSLWAWTRSRLSGSSQMLDQSCRRSVSVRRMLLCRCESWVDRPACLFQISNHENFFHYLNDGFMGVLQTLTETKLLPDRLSRRACFRPHSLTACQPLHGLVHRYALLRAVDVFPCRQHVLSSSARSTGSMSLTS